MPVTYIDPRGVVADHGEEYTLAVDLTTGSPPIALLANGFPDSREFLDAVEAALTEALPGAQVQRFAKPNASAPATETLLKEIAASGCVAAVTAYGH
jgi:hypothetical protein